jgi:hypothetical protein
VDGNRALQRRLLVNDEAEEAGRERVERAARRPVGRAEHGALPVGADRLRGREARRVGGREHELDLRRAAHREEADARAVGALDRGGDLLDVLVEERVLVGRVDVGDGGVGGRGGGLAAREAVVDARVGAVNEVDEDDRLGAGADEVRARGAPRGELVLPDKGRGARGRGAARVAVDRDERRRVGRAAEVGDDRVVRALLGRRRQRDDAEEVVRGARLADERRVRVDAGAGVVAGVEAPRLDGDAEALAGGPVGEMDGWMRRTEIYDGRVN